MPYAVPELGLVVDDGKWEDCCHNTRDGKLPVCGNPNAIKCVRAGVPRPKTDTCPHCGRPVCRACRQIERTWERSGEWEGM